jgi:hypothetical protein
MKKDGLVEERGARGRKRGERKKEGLAEERGVR